MTSCPEDAAASRSASLRSPGGDGEVRVGSQKCACLIGVAHVGGDRVPALEGFLGEEAAGAAGCAENQYFHVSSQLGL